jgi:hypothetical protein
VLRVFSICGTFELTVWRNFPFVAIDLYSVARQGIVNINSLGEFGGCEFRAMNTFYGVSDAKLMHRFSQRLEWAKQPSSRIVPIFILELVKLIHAGPMFALRVPVNRTNTLFLRTDKCVAETATRSCSFGN